jgi:hypothetical protein
MMTHPCSQGEVDIVEGVNDQEPNASSLHTGSGMWLVVSIVVQFDRTELASRVHDATVALRHRDRVSTHLRIHVVGANR